MLLSFQCQKVQERCYVDRSGFYWRIYTQKQYQKVGFISKFAFYHKSTSIVNLGIRFMLRGEITILHCSGPAAMIRLRVLCTFCWFVVLLWCSVTYLFLKRIGHLYLTTRCKRQLQFFFTISVRPSSCRSGDSRQYENNT